MLSKEKKYNLPRGYSYLQVIVKSYEFLKNPLLFISRSMERFSDTYSASLGKDKKLIITKNPAFINYILKENHKNYSKSEFSTKRGVELFGNGLLFSNGNYWLKQRRLVQPGFHREKIQGLQNIIAQSIKKSLNQFQTGDAVDVYPKMYQLSFDILINSLFEISLPTATMKELSLIFSELQEFLIKDINQPFQKYFYPLNGRKKNELRKAKRIREIFAELIYKRRKSEKQHNDLLDMLLTSKYEDTGESMTEEQIIDEALILIFAGHETTANTLSWLLYLIASNELVQHNLRETIANEKLNEGVKNEYLKAVINEGMRLYPAAWMTERVANEDDSFGTISFPKGTIIIPFFYGLHRDGQIWADVLKFKPERFIENPQLSKSNSFFPFGAGPRMCIGNNFALMEMCLFLYHFFQKFKIKITTQIPFEKPLITLRPDKVVLHIESISQNDLTGE